MALKPKSYTAWQKDLIQWIFGNQCLTLFSSPSLRLQSAPGETEREFRARLSQMMRERRDDEVEKLRAKYAPKIATLQDRLMRSQQAVERERQESQASTMSAAIDVGASVLGAMFGGRRRSMATAARTAVRGAGRYNKESGDVARAEETAQAIAAQLDDLEQRFHDEADGIQRQMNAANEPLEQVSVKPKKTNIQVRFLTFAWAPYTSEGKPAW